MNPGEKGRLFDLIEQNIAEVTKIEDAANRKRSKADVVADMVAGFCGSMVFVYVHVALFAIWLLHNTVGLLPGVPRFDPPSFNILTLVVSLEAIFLSTFILISQNRQQKVADHRNHLDLQINLLAEQENSQLLRMLQQIMLKLEIKVDASDEESLAHPTDLAEVAAQIEQSIDSASSKPDKNKA